MKANANFAVRVAAVVACASVALAACASDVVFTDEPGASGGGGAAATQSSPASTTATQASTGTGQVTTVTSTTSTTGSGGASSSGGGGASSSSGGGGASSSAGGGGSSGCIEITAGAFQKDSADGKSSTYIAVPSLNQGAATPDGLNVEFYGPDYDPTFDGDQTGSFDLTQNGDDNYATCSRCLRLKVDGSSDATQFFQRSGTLVLTDMSDQLNGALDATITDVTLEEVTIDRMNGSTSTPVAGGVCLHLASAHLVRVHPPAPPGWTCKPEYADDDDCDCGCGAHDPACADATLSACDYCSDMGSCNTQQGCPGTVKAGDNAHCN